MRLPLDAVMGEVNRGWELAKVTLGNERVSLSSGGALWGMGPSGRDVIDIVRRQGGTGDPLLRQRLARLYTTEEILRLIRLRTVSARIRGEQPGPEVSIRKVLADEHGQETMAVAKDLAATGAMLADVGPMGTASGGRDRHQRGPSLGAGWHHGFLFSPALTIGGGSGDVQRNILAERVLGLPHDLDVEVGQTW